MQSQIDPSLEEETSGPHIGKVLIARLRGVLGIARDESSAHGTAIEQLEAQLANKLDQSAAANFASAIQGAKADTAVQPAALTAGLSYKLDAIAALGFATASQGAKADVAITYEQNTGKYKKPDGTDATIGGSSKVIRIISQAMNVSTEATFNGGTNVFSRTHRSVHQHNVEFDEFRIPIPCFYTDANGIEQLLPEDYRWQVGFEENFLEGNANIPDRPNLTFGGLGIFEYKASDPPPKGYVWSDWFRCANTVQPGQKIGFWMTIEAVGGGDNKIPYYRNSSSFNTQRWIGTISSANVSQIDNNSALTAKSVSLALTTQTGGSNYYAPICMQVKTSSSKKFIAILGSSIPNGVGEGNVNGSGTYGDAFGSAKGNRGFAERGIMEEAEQQIALQLSKGGRTLQDLKNKDNWKYSWNLLQESNADNVINGTLRNDLARADVVPSRVASNPYVKYNIVRANGNNTYMALNNGSSGSATSFAKTGKANIDGGLVWKHMQGAIVSTSGQMPIVIADLIQVNNLIKEALPNAKIHPFLPTLGISSSSDQYTTLAGQTLQIGFELNGKRNAVYSYIMANLLELGFNGAPIDICPIIEDGAPNTTNKWKVNGTPYYLSHDGTHLHSFSAWLCSKVITAELF